MKIFFVEGPDNIGKSTYVRAIQQFLYGKYCTNVLVMHCEKPEGKTIDEQIEFQNNAYEKLVDQLIEWNNNNEYDAIIFDRAWYGEYVYGTMYRNRDKEDVKKRIQSYEQKLLSVFKPYDMKLILLTTESAEFLVKNDDGKSISKADVSLIKKELKLFDEIYEASLFGVVNGINNKTRIYVTQMQNPLTYIKDGVSEEKNEQHVFRDKFMVFDDIKKNIMLNVNFFNIPGV